MICLLWHDGWHLFLWVWVWVWVSDNQRIPLFVLAWKPHNGPAREISDETGRSREKATSQGSQQNKAVNRSRGKTTVRERRLLSEELGPVDSKPRTVNARGWVSVPGGCVGISLGYTLAIARCTENHTKVSQTSPFLHLELTKVRACLFFFSSTLSVV